MESAQVLQKIFLKQSDRAQVVDVTLVEMKVFYIVNDLLKSGTDRITAVYGVVAVKCIENDSLICIFLFEIALHHCQLIKICQQGQVAFTHKKSPCLVL